MAARKNMAVRKEIAARKETAARKMAPRNKKTAARAVAKSQAKSQPKSRTATSAGLGQLPEWNLADLYHGIDDPDVKRDLDRADSYSVAFEEDFKGKLAALAERPDAGAKLADAVM